MVTSPAVRQNMEGFPFENFIYFETLTFIGFLLLVWVVKILPHLNTKKNNISLFSLFGREDFMFYDVIFIKRISPLLVQYRYSVQFSTFLFIY